MKESTHHSQFAADGDAIPTVSISVVRRLLDVVEEAGVSRVAFLRAAGLVAEQLESSEARLPRSEVYRIHELALDLTGDPALGLHWSERMTMNTFGPLSYLVAHAADLRQGYESSCRFGRLMGSDDRYELIEQNGKVTVRCRNTGAESLRIQRFAAEMTLGGFFKVVRAFGVRARPRSLSFAYPAPVYYREYTRVFGRAARFEQAFTGIVFDSAVLSAASPYRDDDVYEALRTMAERRVANLTQPALYTQRVRDLLVQQGRSARMDMQSVARALGLSARSLHRRLISEGTSYSAVEIDAFSIAAKHCLSAGQLTIKETAHELGFSDTSAFHRAFKRATGTTPIRYRQQHEGPSRRG